MWLIKLSVIIEVEVQDERNEKKPPHSEKWIQLFVTFIRY